MAKFVQCSAHSCPELEQATWFLVATGFLEAVTQQHHQQRNLLHTRFQGPGKLQLFQLSLRRRHSSSFWPFVNMETVEGMLLSQLSLLDTCMCACALSSVLVIDMSWIAAWTPHQLARLARHWTSTSAYFFQHGKICSMLCSFLLEPEQTTWLLLNTRFLQAVTRPHQQLRLFPTQGLRCLPNSSCLSVQHCEGDTLHWSDPLRKWKLWREWFSHKIHWLTPACVPCLRYWWLIWTGLLHERPSNRQDWQDIKLAQVIQVLIFFQHGNIVQCSAHSCPELEQHTWLLVATGFLEAVTQQHHQPRNLENPSFFSSPHCEGDTLHRSDPLWTWKLWREWFSQCCHCLTPACVCVRPPFGTGDWYELDCCTNAPSIGKTGKKLN